MVNITAFINGNLLKMAELEKKEHCSSKGSDCWKGCKAHKESFCMKDTLNMLVRIFSRPADISMFSIEGLFEAMKLLDINNTLAWNPTCPIPVLSKIVDEAIKDKEKENIQTVVWNRASAPLLKEIKEKVEHSDMCQLQKDDVFEQLALNEKTSVEVLQDLLRCSDSITGTSISRAAEENLRKRGGALQVDDLKHYHPLKRGIRCRVIELLDTTTAVENLITKAKELGIVLEQLPDEEGQKFVTLTSDEELFAKQEWLGGGIGPVFRFISINDKAGNKLGTISGQWSEGGACLVILN